MTAGEPRKPRSRTGRRAAAAPQEDLGLEAQPQPGDLNHHGPHPAVARLADALVAFAPFAIGGVLAGTRVHLQLSREQFVRAVAMLVIIAGVSLLIRSATF